MKYFLSLKKKNILSFSLVIFVFLCGFVLVPFTNAADDSTTDYNNFNWNDGLNNNNPDGTPEDTKTTSKSSSSGAGSGSSSDSRCNPEEELFFKWSDIFDLDIRRTVANMITSALGTVFSAGTGFSLTQVVQCQNYVSQNGGNEIMVGGASCSGTPDTDCAALVNNYAYTAYNFSSPRNLADSRVGGSLLGVAYAVENYNNYAPDAANLAYFWNDTASRIPFLNKAFAADNYPYILVNSILDAWKLVRNIAFALMAAVFMFTGVLIVMRRSVNQKMVVTVQYALPKIVVGLLLIAFSYPIGATLTSLGLALSRSGLEIVSSLFPSLSSSADFGLGIFIVGVIAASLAAFGAGSVVLLLLTIVFIALTLMWLYVQLKILIVYMKMLFSTVSAPIEFAMGSIPGSEDKLTGWFKRMGKYVLTLALMGLIAPLTLYMGIMLLKGVNGASSVGGASELGGWGSIIAVLAVPLLLIYGFGLAAGMESKVEGWLGEGKKR